jgi:hypothetical protein
MRAVTASSSTSPSDSARSWPRAEGVAQPAGGHHRHATGVHAAPLDGGAVDAPQRGGAGGEQAADRLGFPAHARQCGSRR